MKQVTRYHPLLVALHWLLAFLIIAALFAGFFLLARMPNSDPQKIRVLLVPGARPRLWLRRNSSALRHQGDGA